MFMIIISVHESTEEERAYIKEISENAIYCECVQVKNDILFEVVYYH